MRTPLALVALVTLAGCPEKTPAADPAPAAAAPAPAPAAPKPAPSPTAGEPESAGARLAPGDTAPDFTLPQQDGEQFTLSAHAGKTVVLWWYPKADTPGCTMEGQGFRDQSPAFAEKDAVVVGISLDTVEEIRAFREKHGFGYPLLSDTGGQVSAKYGAVTGPEQRHAARITYVIGPEGTVKKVYEEVDVSSHAATVLEAL